MTTNEAKLHVYCHQCGHHRWFDTKHMAQQNIRWHMEASQHTKVDVYLNCPAFMTEE